MLWWHRSSDDSQTNHQRTSTAANSQAINKCSRWESISIRYGNKFNFIIHFLYYFSVESKTSSLNRCQEIIVPTCKNIGYNLTSFPNYFEHRIQSEAGLEVHQFYPLFKVKCSEHLQLFLCSLYTPMCFFNSNGARQLIPPCRSLCEHARNGCSGLMMTFGFRWPDLMNCSLFPEEDKTTLCIRSPQNGKCASMQLAMLCFLKWKIRGGKCNHDRSHHLFIWKQP